MIVPEFWAEGRIQSRVDGRQITVRRFGWSDQDQPAAQAHADARTREAFDRIVAGEKLERRETRVAYNGAEGVPIREQIVQREGETVVTRNSYGARCLNTAEVLFADIDVDGPDDPRRGPGRGRRGGTSILPWLAVLVGAAVGWSKGSAIVGVSVAVMLLIASFVWRWAASPREKNESVGESAGPENEDRAQQARSRIEDFVARHPDWHVRLYRTPAGWRVLAMHRTFSAREPEVVACFEGLGVDPVYARMCRNQNCFRARVSAKPWRIGIGDHLRPRTGVWPVARDTLSAREAWVARYERAAEGHAACRFVAELGGGAVDPAAQAVQRLHDALCRAESGLPIA